MELRSSRVLKRGKPESNSSIQNHDFGDKKRLLPLSSDRSRTSGKKGANEVEIGACVDNADDNLETGSSNGSKIVSFEGGKNGGNTDDKGVFLGSEVLDPIKDLVVSCPEGEIEEESVEHVQVESSSVDGGGGEEGNKPVLINSSEKDGGFTGKIAAPHKSSTGKLHSSPEVELTDCENKSENVESGKFADLDDSNLLNDSENADDGMEKSRKTKGKCHRGRKKRNAGNLKKNERNRDSDTRSKETKVEKADFVSGESGDGGVKRKRGRKRKNVESFECNENGIAKKEKVEKGRVQVGGRVLRSRVMTIGGGVEVVDGGRIEVVIGLKRMTKEDDSTELAARPNKKLKRRGRPRKVQPGEIPSSNVFKTDDENREPSPRLNKKLKRRGRPRKVQQGETTVKKDGILMEILPKKKLKRRGRPPKVSYETKSSDEAPKRSRGRPRKDTVAAQGVQKNRHKDTIFKKLKRRGRPPKMDSRALANVIKMRTVKLMEVKKNSNRLKGSDVKRVPKIQKIRKEDGLLEVTGENPQKIQQFEENSEKITAEGKEITSKPMKRLKRKQLVRDKIAEILLKAGWIIDLRPRQERKYMDAVYIEPSGRSHWSITRAYLMLKKKIEDGDADNNEVSAYTPISEEEIGLLFRVVDKVHGYKKKKNRNLNDVNKAGNGIIAKRKNKAGKNTKNGSKRKKIRNSAGKFANKSLKNPNRKKGIVTESRKPRLLARSSEKVSKQDNDGCLVYSGKRNLLSWMIDLGVILAGSKVQYGKTRRQKKSSEGVITSDGIHCGCCNEIMGVSRFVAHAGGKLNQPFDNVYLESGTSLLKCMLDSWRKEEESNTVGFNRVNVKGDDPNDDTCNICGDGGNLICCDGCPSTFHQSCLDIQNFPSGDWNCIYCSCKFCGVVSVNAPQMDDSRDELTSEMLSCRLCEEKFHRSCLQEAEDVNVDFSRLPFCGRKCQELFEQLQTHLGVKVELEDGFSWTLLQRSDVGQDFTVHDTQLKVECNSKLAVAFSVMDECFVPIVDERSGTSIIRNVVYNCGSNFKRLNYAGFLTAILEKGDELITAASIRIHGYRLAEMPFIGTRHMYRRQGMCRRLLDAIEFTLSSIGVEELIIPAIPELLQTWTKVFGFMPLEESKRQAMKNKNMIVFPGINMLEKPLLQNSLPDRSPTPSAASDVAGIVKDDAEEATVLMDVCSCPDPNNKTVSQFEPTTSNAIDCNQRPAYEQTEEPTVLMDGCSRHEEATDVIPKDGLDHEPLKETSGLTGCFGCPKENVSRLDNDKLTIPDGANGLCDLNFPVKNNRCRVPETTGPISSDAKSTDVRTSNDSVAAATCGLDRSPKLESDVENDGISGAEASPTTSKLGLKNTFDLNLHPTAVDTDTHIVVGDDSLANEPCRTTFELLETRSRVEHDDSKPCDTQSLVML